MSIIKLQPGAPAVRFLVTRIEDDKSTRGTSQWKFVGRTPTDADALVYVSSETAERQCARIGLTRATIIGTWVEFSKTSQNFIDINLSSADAQPPVEPATPRPEAPATQTTGGASLELDPARKKEILVKEKALLSYAFGCVNRALPAWLSECDIELDTLPPEIRAQCLATLGGAFYQGLSARGMAQ